VGVVQSYLSLVRAKSHDTGPSLTCHSTNIFSGLHHHTFEDAFELEPYCKDNSDSLDPTYWMQRLSSVMSKALQTLMQIKYERDEFEQLAQLLSVTKYFDEEVLRIKRQCQDLLGMCSAFPLMSQHNAD
jgi:hypothetical protein